MLRISTGARAAFVAAAFLSQLSIGTTVPARADSRTNEEIRRQQREECERHGGRYDYPKCYLPKERGSSSSASGSSCGWLCKLTIGAAALVVGSVAYCKANPDKC